jgi:hypothetical protein
MLIIETNLYYDAQSEKHQIILWKFWIIYFFNKHLRVYAVII